MKKPDPRLAKVERLLSQAVRLLSEMKAGVPAPRRTRRRRRKVRPRYSLPGILDALNAGADIDLPTGERDARLPTRATLQRYRSKFPDFGRQASEVLATRAKPPPRVRVRKVGLPGGAYDWDEILKLIEAGATIGPSTTNRCGLPSHTMIMARRKAVPEFGAAVARVLDKRARDRRRPPIDRPSVLMLIRRGAVIKACPPEPGMPWKDQLDDERRADPAFNREVRAAITEARRRRATIASGVTRDLDWDAVADEIERGATVYSRSRNRGSLPSEKRIMQRIRADPVFAARVKPILAARTPKRRDWQVDFEDVLERVRCGVRVDTKPPAPGMPSQKVLARLRRQNPGFRRDLAAAIAEARRRDANRSELSKCGRDAAWRLSQAAVPQMADADFRDDIVSELCVMLVGGIVGPTDDLSAAWKACRTKLNRPRWKEVSLDAPIGRDEGVNWVERLTDDHPRP